MCAVVLGFAHTVNDKKQTKWVAIGGAFAAVFSVFMAVMKKTVGNVNKDSYNIDILSATVVCFALFVAMSWLYDSKIFVRFISKNRLEKIVSTARGILAAALPTLFLMYTLPIIFVYPWEFVEIGETIISTDYLVKLLGFLGGIITAAAVSAALYKVVSRTPYKISRIILSAVFVLSTIEQLKTVAQALFASRKLLTTDARWLFKLIIPLINNPMVFIYLAAAAAFAAALTFWIWTLVGKKKTRTNPAETRKERAIMVKGRKNTAVLAAFLILSLISMTVLKAYNEKPIELPPLESYTVVDGYALIPLEQVNDGALHRFAHYSDDGTEIRFIIVLKNGADYGVGFDACKICGATGYYERDGQVVCKLCDVVMNKQTIGLEGGCNPYPLAYYVSNGSVFISIEDLEAEKARFK
jgi:uncharacterized membrane protein